MDKITQRKLKMLVESEYWGVMGILVDEIVKKWNSVPVKAEDQFNTVYNLAHKDGKIEGVREFINSLEQLAHND